MTLDAVIATASVLGASAYVVWHMVLRRRSPPPPKVVVGGALQKAMQPRR